MTFTRPWLFLFISVIFGIYTYFIGPVTFEDYSDLVMYVTQYGTSYWNPDAAFGAPNLNPQSFALHPLAFFYSAFSLPLAHALFVACHVGLGLMFLNLLLKKFALSAWVEWMLFFAYVLGPSGGEYFIAYFYPSLIVSYAVMPLLFYLALSFLDSTSKMESARAICLFSIAAAFLFLNSHPGMNVSLLIVLALFLLVGVVTERERRGSKILFLILGGILTVVLSAEKLMGTFHELSFMDPNGTRSGFGFAFGKTLFWNYLARPFVVIRGAPNFDVFLSEWLDKFRERGAFGWSPGIGAPVFLLTICALFYPKIKWKHHLAWRFVFLFCLWAIRANPKRFLHLLSGSCAFRESLVFLSFLLAGIALKYLEGIGGGRWKGVSKKIVGVQFVFILAMPFPYLLKTKKYLDEGVYSLRDIEKLDQEIKSGKGLPFFSAPQDQRRVYFHYSSMYWQRPLLLKNGINVAAGFYKGVSMDSLYPSKLRFYGYVPENTEQLMPQERNKKFDYPGLLEDPSLLDVLSVNYVIGLERDQARIPKWGKITSPSLEIQNRFFSGAQAGQKVLIYQNPGAWPKSFLMDRNRIPDSLPARKDCWHDRLFCKDFSLFARERPFLTEGVYRADRHRIEVSLPRKTKVGEVLFVSQMFRNDWKAADDLGNRLEVTPIFGALLGVVLKPGAQEIHLEYRPMFMVWSRRVSWTLFLLLLGFLSYRFSSSILTKLPKPGQSLAKN